MHNGSNSQKASNGGPLGPNHFQSSYSFQKPYESATGVLQKNASNDISLDALSNAAGSYVGKSKLFRARSAIHTKRGGTNKAIFYQNFNHNLDEQTPADSNIKVYIPKEYFKHTGYIKDDQSSNATNEKQQSRGGTVQSRQQPRKPQTPFKERFNEKLEYPNAPPSNKLGKQMINQIPRVRHVGGGVNAEDAVSVMSKVVSQVDDTRSKATDIQSVHTAATNKSRPQTASMMKRKILERISQLDENQLALIGKDLDVKPDDVKLFANSSVSNDDKASIIT